MSVRLTLICHAQAAVPGMRFLTDEPADADGLAAARALAAALDPIDRVWTAPELRCRETAAVLGAEATHVAELRDGDFGTWRGRELAAIAAADPEGIAAWLGDMDAAPHCGESLLQIIRRVGDWLAGFDERGHTVAVSHPAVIRAALIHVLEAPSNSFRRIDAEPLTILDLRRHAGKWSLRSIGQK